MVRPFVVLPLALLTLGAFAGVPASAVTYHYVYDVAGMNVVWDVCYDINTVGTLAGHPELDEEVCGLNDGHIQLGGVQNMETETYYNAVIISASDMAFTHPFISGAYSQEVGGFAEEAFGEGCRPILSTERNGNYLNLFINIAHVEDDLTLCFGSRGDVYADFF